MTDQQQPQHMDTTAITSGRTGEDGALGSVLYASSAFEVSGLDALRRKAVARRADRFYSRYANPTVTSFEAAVAELEGAEAGLAFASGMGAVATVVFALCSPGDHIVAQRQIYSGTQLLLQAGNRSNAVSHYAHARRDAREISRGPVPEDGNDLALRQASIVTRCGRIFDLSA